MLIVNVIVLPQVSLLPKEPMRGKGPRVPPLEDDAWWAGNFLERSLQAVSPKSTLKDLMYRMVSERRDAFVVWEEGPKGIIDYHHVLVALAAGKQPKNTTIEDVFRPSPIPCVEKSENVLGVLAWMAKKRSKMVAVVEGSQFLGVITLESLMKGLADLIGWSSHEALVKHVELPFSEK